MGANWCQEDRSPTRTGGVRTRKHMKSKGQQSFVNLPNFTARLYNSLTLTRAIQRQHQEIARDLVIRLPRGRLLDIGTGPGKVLCEVHQLNPEIELFGLDISEAMVQLTREPAWHSRVG